MQNLGQGVQVWIAFSREGRYKASRAKWVSLANAVIFPTLAAATSLSATLNNSMSPSASISSRYMAAVSGSFSMSLLVSLNGLLALLLGKTSSFSCSQAGNEQDDPLH